MVGKYVDLTDVLQEPERGALPRRLRAPRARSRSTTSTRRSSTTRALLAHVDGILVPHGFGSRGVEGKIRAVRYAREQQRAVLRHLLRHADGGDRVRAPRRRASSARTRREVDPETPHPVIDLLPEQRGVEAKGATMRLGAWPCVLRAGHARVRGLRRARDLRAPPPPLRVQPRVPRPARARRASCSRAPRPTAGSSRSSRSPTTRGSSAASSTPSSSRRRSAPTRCSWRSSAAARWRRRAAASTAVDPRSQPARPAAAARPRAGYSSRFRGVSSVGRAPCSHRGGHWFEPSTSHQPCSWPGSSVG